MFIILDRDGVINHDSDDYIKAPDEWLPIESSIQAIADLTKAGYQIIIATNQSGIARGFYDVNTLEQIHQKLHETIENAGGKITEIFFCPHHPEDNCTCRKPQIGMFEQIQEKYSIDLSNTYFVGDSITDIRAARAAGCIPILVLTGNGQKTLANYPEVKDVQHFDDLAAYAKFLETHAIKL